MKNKIFIAALFLFSPFFLFAQNILNIEIETGIMNGNIYEEVKAAYLQGSNGSYQLVPTYRESLLDWEIKNIPYYAVSVSNPKPQSFYFNLKAKFTPSNNSGNIQDYDWLSADESFSNYSIHSNILKNYTTLLLCAGYDFSINSDFLKNKNISIELIPSVGFEYETFAFYSKGGYRSYKSENWEKIYYPSIQISDYKQDNFFTFANLQINTNYLSKFEFLVDSSLYFIIKSTATDNHILRNIVFKDNFDKGYYFDVNLKLTYNMDTKNALSLKGGINFMPEILGITDSNEGNTTWKTSINSLGCTHRKYFTTAVCYTIKF